MTQKNAQYFSLAVTMVLAVALIMGLDLIVRDMEFTWALMGWALSIVHIIQGFAIIGIVIGCLFLGDRLENRLWRRSVAAAKKADRYMSGYDGYQRKE